MTFIISFSALNNKLEQQPEWIKDQSTGKITGYKFGGADTVFPFNNLEEKIEMSAECYSGNKGADISIPVTTKKKYLIFVTSVGAGSGYRYILRSGGNILFNNKAAKAAIGFYNNVNAYGLNDIYIIQATANTLLFTSEDSTTSGKTLSGSQIRCFEID